MATVNLGSIKFKWKGTYNGATAYTVDDVVSYNGSSYICILASTGNLPTNGTYFEQMSGKGTDADLLSIASTAQGDLYYNNGGAIARLGAGTAGQVLQTGGAGANPSWTTMSSDVVKLASATASSSSFITFEDYYSSTYGYYQIVGYNVQYSAQNSLRFQLAYGAGHTYPSSGYYSFTHGGYTDFSSTYNGQWADGNNNSGGFNVSWDHGTSSTITQNFRANFYNLNSTDGSYKNIDCLKFSGGTSWALANVVSGGYTSESNLISNAITGIRVYPNSGNFVKGQFILYGYKV